MQNQSKQSSSLVDFIVSLGLTVILCFLLRLDKETLIAINKSTSVYILLLLSMIFQTYYADIRPKNPTFNSSSNESIYFYKYGHILYIIITLIMLTFSIHLAFKYSWYFFFTPLYLAIPAKLFFKLLKRPYGVIEFLILYVLCFIWTIFNLF